MGIYFILYRKILNEFFFFSMANFTCTIIIPHLKCQVLHTSCYISYVKFYMSHFIGHISLKPCAISIFKLKWTTWPNSCETLWNWPLQLILLSVLNNVLHKFFRSKSLVKKSQDFEGRALWLQKIHYSLISNTSDFPCKILYVSFQLISSSHISCFKFDMWNWTCNILYIT